MHPAACPSAFISVAGRNRADKAGISARQQRGIAAQNPMTWRLKGYRYDRLQFHCTRKANAVFYARFDNCSRAGHVVKHVYSWRGRWFYTTGEFGAATTRLPWDYFDRKRWWAVG